MALKEKKKETTYKNIHLFAAFIFPKVMTFYADERQTFFCQKKKNKQKPSPKHKQITSSSLLPAPLFETTPPLCQNTVRT
jgi:hypothetical protein